MDDYKFSGLELTPNIFGELLILHFDGKQFKRSTAIDKITQYHSQNGGLLEKNEYVSVFKKTCQKLSASGLTNVGYGTWKLNYQEQNTVIVKTDEEEDVEVLQADSIVGEGNESVYVYYYDTYKNFAQIKGKNIWECKVGRSEKSPLQRILSQAGTCYPELPHVALIIKCEDSAQLETALHSVLKLRKRWISSAPGVEWFLTSPEEILALYKSIVKG